MRDWKRRLKAELQRSGLLELECSAPSATGRWFDIVQFDPPDDLEVRAGRRR